MDYLEIIKWVVLCIVGFIMSYLGFKNTFFAQITAFITEAELKYQNTEKAGKDKMAYVVKKVRDMLPVVFRPFFTDEWIEKLVQQIFDSVKEFVALQLKNLGNKTTEKIENKEEK